MACDLLRLDGRRLDDEILGDLGVGQAARQQEQDLTFTRREVGQTRRDLRGRTSAVRAVAGLISPWRSPIPFLACLSVLLRAAEGPGGWLANTALAAGVCGVALSWAAVSELALAREPAAGAGWRPALDAVSAATHGREPVSLGDLHRGGAMVRAARRQPAALARRRSRRHEHRAGGECDVRGYRSGSGAVACSSSGS